MSRYKVGPLIIILLALFTLVSGCGTSHDFNKQLRTITKPYRFDLVKWEFETLGGEVGELFRGGDKAAANATSEIITYFTNAAQIRNLEATINAVKAENQSGDLNQLQNELDELRRQNAGRSEITEKALEAQVRETLSEHGIFNPIDKHVKSKVGFPPVKIHLGNLPHLLVVSPRDRIESTKEIMLLPEMSREDMEKIEDKVDSLGVSSLVVGLGGLSTYPSYVIDEADLRFTIETIVHEWMHQYLAFTPLGFRYILDQTGIRADYEIATINETVAGMVSKEIGAIMYKKYAPQEATESTPPETNESGFDFNKEMREIRLAVDDYLAQGQIEQAEEYMEQKRQYLAENGYHIRKLNQAYFAFYGTYADSPTSISPIGAELRKLREQSDSLKEFLDSVVGMTSRQDLDKSVK
jgi:hypothetical protein